MSSVMRGALLLAFLAASSARANDISDNIIVTGGEVVEQGDNVVITYTRTQIEAAGGVGTLSFKAGQATADVLAVGGGGGGGRTRATSNGGGGGGGAGGFVEVTGLSFKGAYEIVVGAGGPGHAALPSVASQGGDGGDTTIKQNGVQVAGIAVAKGGGGGGAGGSESSTTGVGRDGGSGGGGSARKKTSTSVDSTSGGGGAGTDGQGNNGGKASVRYAGAGGGGAKDPGPDVTTNGKSLDTSKGYGGSGKQSTITGEYYAGGGAGADTRASGSGVGTVAGSLGGGGSGGDSSNTGSRNATQNTGSGGGGGNTGVASGNGADGIVVIRLSGYVAGGVVVPTPAFTYDGNAKTAAVDTAYYTLSGDVVKTAAGNYTMTMTLTAAGQDLGWDDPSDPRISGNTATISWSIAKKPIAKPEKTAESFTYTGEAQTGYAASTDYTLTGDNTAVNAGTYTVTAALTDPANTKWADDAANPRSDLQWTIEKRKIDAPARAGTIPYTHIYNGEGQTGFVASVYYTLDENNVRTNASTYTVTATLNDPVNNEWKTGTPSLSWTIQSKTVDESVLVVKTGLYFTATEQTAYDPTAAELVAYTLSGHRATNAGSYVMTATLNNPAGYDNYVWAGDNSTTPQVRGWSIAAKQVAWPPDGALATYEYAADTLREPVPPSDWYTIVDGVGGETNVGTYACTVQLTYNESSVTNEIWSDDASVTNKTWNWSITAHRVDPPVIGSFTYRESPKGTATPQTVLAIDASADYEKTGGDDLTQSSAGNYSFTLSLKDEANYVWNDTGLTAPRDFSWTIEKAANVIEGLTIKDWQVGDTSLHRPDCTDVAFGEKSDVLYSWELTKTGTNWKAWSSGAPTAAGTYYLRATTSEKANWTAAESFKRFCVWKNPADVFTDFADITVTGAVGGKPVEIRLSEPTLSGYVVTGGLPGFEYLRTGVNASELRFVLTNAVKTADLLLPFTNRTWNAGGESVLWVQLPEGVASTTTIRMYWHAADGNSQSDNYPEDVGAPASGTASFSLVNREGAWVDYWTSNAAITDTAHLYDAGNPWPVEADVTPPTLKSGTVTRQVLKLPRETPHDDLQTEPGSYAIVYSRAATAGESYTVYLGDQRLEYTIRLSNTYGNLGGTTGGRTLLGNNDTNTECPIGGQAYWQTDQSALTYWTHEGEDAPSRLPNLDDGIDHVLYHVIEDVTNVLWRLVNMRIGSIYPNNGQASNQRNYLPWSSTCWPRTSATATMSPAEVSYLVMRNIADAAIYSQCYTNGIGTIYFDAVNGWANDTGAKVVVEIATETSKGELPTDENCAEGDDPFFYLTHDADGSLLTSSHWRSIKPTVLFKHSTSNAFEVVPTASATVSLQATTGGKTDEFYRIIAQVNESRPCRFRIRRTGAPSGDLDLANLILLDNVIASPPPMYAEMESPGVSDADAGRTGKQALGYAGALGKAFPSIRDTEVTGRGAVTYSVTPGIDYDVTRGFIASARFHYRWRYLNQKVDPVWKTLYLDHEAAAGVEGEVIDTVAPMALDGKVGDLEWYYDLTLQAPAYKYIDYSGCGVEKPVGDYEEARTSVTSRLDAASSLASGGADWFARLREGESPYEQLVLKTDLSDDALGRGEIQMELVADHVWRGYFKTVDPIEGGFRYRIEPRNRQTDGDTHYSYNTNYWYAESDARMLPVSAVLATDGDTNSWARIPCDATTGYLLFQVDDETKSISIVHADYQDCDLWNDAKNDDLFTGNSTEDATKSGVSPRMKEFKEEFSYETVQGETLPWTATPSTKPTTDDPEWKDTFDGSASQSYGIDEPFGTTKTLADWTTGPGMFVCQRYGGKKEASGAVKTDETLRALQMEGCGKGWLQFPVTLTDTTRPRGLATVDFKARLGQFISLDDDIAYADASMTAGATHVTTNYTFMALGAFDTQKSMAFSGRAALSLFAYYRPRRGAYELRVEQTTAAETASDGPGRKRQLTLYRWTADRSGKMTAVPLATTLDNALPQFYYKNTSEGAFRTSVKKGHYMPLYICCSNEPNATVIRVGVWHEGNAGVGFNNSSLKDAISGKKFYTIVYRDTDTTSRLKSGTYGVLSTNCKGVFLRPHVGAPVKLTTATGTSAVWKNDNVTTFPSLAECKADLKSADERWNISYGRMEAFLPEVDQGDDFYLWGIQAASDLSQKLALQISPRGKNEWMTAKVFEIKGFGTSDSSGDPYSHRFDLTADQDVRFVVQGSIDDPRTDIVIDDPTITQWRSGSYGDRDTTSYVADDAAYGWRNSFTFSSAWIKNDGSATASVLLSPKRTAGAGEVNTKACAIRSPLMDGAGTPARGIGLGLISFEYRNAQENAKLVVQIATNNVGNSATGYDTYDDAIWTTVTNIDFSAMTAAQRKKGTVAHYLGLHGVKGLMRIAAATSVVKQVAPTNWLDEARYGEVEITQVYCRDEPAIDLTAWWGWNLQTTDHTDRQYLVDNLKFGSSSGLSIGLNRGIRRPGDNVADDPETYKRQMPFVQTPTFTSNDVGEVTFRARKYDNDETSPYAEVVLYGATLRTGTQDLAWKCASTDRPLATFVVSNTTYTTYTYKTKPGENYKAFRLGVAGIEDIDEPTRGMSSRGEGVDPVRVLVDEILVSEAIRPKVGFRYCRPFRTGVAASTALPYATVMSCDEQPIAGDSWSVQAQIEVRLLPDELDLVTHKPRVIFHWYDDLRPWGFANWRKAAGAQSAELSPAEGETMVFRGSYVDSPGAIVLPTTETLSYVQYAAEVIYYDMKGNCITGVLDAAEWERPAWYTPIDLNARFGGASGDFSAYNILESVSPNRVWINEANVFDGRDAGYNYLAETNQYVEIALPIGQDIRGWSLACIDNAYQTNTMCVFGENGVAASKTQHVTNDYVFLTVQSPQSAKKGWLSKARGEVDGTWQVFDGAMGELDQTHPIGLLLKRPSGIIEQEIALEGTNTWASTVYAARFSLTNFVANVRKGSAESTMYEVGNEYGGAPGTSLGVTERTGEEKALWANGMRKTPGRCNAGQVIPEHWAIYPSGEMVIVYASIAGAHIRHTFGDVTNGTETALVAVKKDGAGTNIVYHLDTWYEIESITEDGVVVPGTAGGGDGFTFTAGADKSRNVSVVAKARPRSDLAETYGLTPDNRYTPAVLSWLEGGATMKGPFRNPGEIHLPLYRSYRRSFTKELSLTDAYWLDIDPTGSNWVFWAGMCERPYVKETRFSRDGFGHPQLDPTGDLVKTNITLGVFMVITNETEDVGDRDYAKNWSPYMLRGLTPGETSYDYTTRGEQNWTSVTFKVTGDIQNGKEGRARWVPMRYFVFGKDSFDAEHKSRIDIPDPYANYSEGAAYGWLDYIGCPVFYRWSIDTRLSPTTIELLQPSNLLDSVW